MTREEAISRLKEGEPFSEIYDSSWNEALDMAISALSADGEYIKKEDALQALHDFWDECIGYDGSGAEMMLDNESVINSLHTYSFPDSADIEKARAEIEEYRNILIPPKTSLKNLLEVQSALNKVLEIIDKHIGGKAE